MELINKIKEKINDIKNKNIQKKSNVKNIDLKKIYFNIKNKIVFFNMLKTMKNEELQKILKNKIKIFGYILIVINLIIIILIFVFNYLKLNEVTQELNQISMENQTIIKDNINNKNLIDVSLNYQIINKQNINDLIEKFKIFEHQKFTKIQKTEILKICKNEYKVSLILDLDEDRKKYLTNIILMFFDVFKNENMNIINNIEKNNEIIIQIINKE